MGMAIEKIIKKLLWFEDYNEDTYCGGDRIQDEYGDWFYKVTEEDFEAFRQAADIIRKYQQLQADYESRLKADMVAMLTDLQLEIEELDTPNNGSAYMDCVEIIQEKINSLKED